MEVSPKYLTETECAAITKISVHTLRNQRFERRGIPYSKLSRSVRYALQDVTNYMEARRIDPEGVMTDEV